MLTPPPPQAASSSPFDPAGVGPHPLTADQLLRSQETTLARLVATGTIADSRSGLVISSNIAMLGALVASFSRTTLPAAASWWWLLVGLTSAGCLASIAMAALAAFPRPGTRPGSLVFFASIAEMPREAYFERLRTVPQADFARDLADQCHRVAVLAALKFRWGGARWPRWSARRSRGWCAWVWPGSSGCRTERVPSHALVPRSRSGAGALAQPTD